jgi:hypothetical protein
MATFVHDTDWQKEMINRNAMKSSHTVAFAGGGENATYSSSLNYFTQDGIVGKGKSNFDRITYRLNTTFDLGRVTVGSNLNFVNIKNRGAQYAPDCSRESRWRMGNAKSVRHWSSGDHQPNRTTSLFAS